MIYNPLAIKRRNILGDLYDRCETINSIPVYMNNKSEEPIGFVDESLGDYVDGFVFHLPEDVCKRLSVNGYEIGVDYSFSDINGKTDNHRIKLNHIILVAKQSANPIPRHRTASITELVK